MNEVSDLRLIIEEIDSAVRERGKESLKLRKDHAHAIASVLIRAKSEFEALSEIISDGVFRTDPETGRHTVGRISWVRHKSRIKRSQTQLKDIRSTLSTLCSNTTMLDVTRIQIQLDGLVMMNDNYKAQLEEQTRLLEALLRQHHESDSMDIPSDDEGQSSSTSGNEDDTSTNQIPSSKPSSLELLEAGQQPHSTESSGSIRLRATRYRRTRCEGWCSCRCHRVQALQTPSMAKFLLGSLFIGYNGFPSLSPKCTEKTCRQRSVATLKIAYHFPAWCLSRMLHFAFSGSSMDGPQTSLSMPRVIPDNSEIFVCAVQGDLDGMRSLFDRGVASPFDIGVGTGRSALHYAVNYDNLEVTQLLLDAGASPHVEDLEHATTVALAWRRVFGSLSEPSTVTTYQNMFQDEEFLESRVFQPLHKIVLGLSSASLEERLKLSTDDIDALDGEGRTALSWAATRGDIEAVRTLLRFGADPNIPSYWGQLPLHWAAQNKRQDPCPILQLLLDHNTDVKTKDYWSRTALTYASGNHADLAPIKLLVEKGTPLDVRDRRLRTALGYAARMGNLKHARYLLESGADPNLPDEFNVIPLLEAVKNNFHEILSLLLPHSCPLETQPYGSTLLHWVAAYSDSASFDILQTQSSSDLFDGSELNMTNAEGSTPQDIFSQRLQPTEKEKTDFDALIERIMILVEASSGQTTPQRSNTEDIRFC